MINKKTVANIKLKYQFQKRYPLYTKLTELQKDVSTHFNLEKSHARPSQEKKLLQNVSKHAKNLKEAMDEALKKDIQKSTPQNWYATRINISALIVDCDRSIKKLLPDKTGRPFKFARVHIIQRLAAIFFNGKAEGFTTHTSAYNEHHYEGQFFRFLLDVKEEFGLLDSPITIGKIAKSELKKFKHLKR